MPVTSLIPRGLLLAALLGGAALPGFAQGVGEIRGNVLDSTGAILPGATVTLTNTQGAVGGNQETVSDSRGTFGFVRLVPGTYSVRAQLTGFQTVTQGNIVVNADATARADLRLGLGAIEEAIIVTSQAPLLDTSNAIKQTTITKAELDALPNRTDIWSVTKVLPSVVMNKIDVGGSEAFNASVPIVRGATGDSKFMVDGMDVSSPSGAGTIANFYLDPFSYEETSIQLGAGSAENSTGGINFNMITRSGTNRFHGGAKFNGTTPGLANGKNYSDELRAQLLAGVPPKVLAQNPDMEPGADIQKMTDVGAWLSGPIVRDKLWFAGTWHDQRMDQHYLGGYNPDGTQAIDDNVLWNYTAKVSWQATRSAQLSYFTDIQYKLNGHFVQGNTRASFGDDASKQHVYKYPTIHQVKFTTPIRNSMAFDAIYSRFRSDNAFLPQPEVNLGDIARFDSVTSVQSVAYTPGTCTAGVCDGYYTTPLFREQVRTSLSISKSRHDLKVGYEFVDITRDTRIWLISPFQANYQNGLPTSVNTYTLPVGDSTDPRETIDNLFSYHAREHGAYVQDRWTLSRNVVLNLGLRYETNRSWQPPSCAPKSDFFAGACYNEVRAPKFRDFAPRSSVVWDLFGDGLSVLKGTANRYNAPLGVDPLGRLNPISAPFDTRQWLPQSRCNDVIGGVPVTGCDRNGDLVPTLNELGTAPGYVFAGVNARYQDELQRPVVNEYTVEYQRQLPQGMVVSAGYVKRQTRSNLAQRNTAVPTSAWIGPMTVTEVVSGQTVQVWNRPSSASANLFYNSGETDTNYDGADLSLTKRFNRRWSMLSGATFGRARVATRGGNRNDPNILNAYDDNPLSTADRPWSYRVSGNYELPWQFFVSGTWQHQIGAPETTTVSVTNATVTLAQGTQVVQVAPLGDVRFPNVAQLDLNIRKTFTIPGSSQRLTPRVEIFNATNEATITAWVTALGPTYHRPSLIQHGRLIKFELGYEF